MLTIGSGLGIDGDDVDWLRGADCTLSEHELGASFIPERKINADLSSEFRKFLAWFQFDGHGSVGGCNGVLCQV